MFWAIRRLFEHVARERPLVVVIEDIHWAEPTLLDLIEHVADWSRDVPLLLLCPARPELLDASTVVGWRQAQRHDRPARAAGSRRDGEPDRRAARRRGASARNRGSQSSTAGEGNPLYVEEMLGMLVDDGLLPSPPSGSWIASKSSSPRCASRPRSARCSRLASSASAPDERAVAERASVVGRVFEQAAVAELVEPTPCARRSARTCWPSCARSSSAPIDSELSAGDAFKFRHILIRDAAYEALPKSERAMLHERFADWLERTVGERLTEYRGDRRLPPRGRLPVSDRARRDRPAPRPTLADQAAAHLAAAGGRALDRGDMPAAVTTPVASGRRRPDRVDGCASRCCPTSASRCSRPGRIS